MLYRIIGYIRLSANWLTLFTADLLITHSSLDVHSYIIHVYILFIRYFNWSQSDFIELLLHSWT